MSALQAFIAVSGAAVPLLRDNIDTDLIIRIDRLTSLRPEQLGPHALEALRRRADGSPDPDCVLNQPAFHAAPILIAGANFGCGSSREAAVWALMAMGLRCVIAPSFGDIFVNNCFQNGMLPIRVPLAEVRALAAQCKDGAAMQVDLRMNTLTAPDGTVRAFGVDAMRREGLLRGLDPITLTLEDDALIRRWQEDDRVRRPWVWQ